MMMAAVGPMVKVTGRRIAAPATGPMPGSTPTSMPRTQPISAKARFVGCRAVAKPAMRRSRLVTARSPVEQAGGQRLAEHAREERIHAEAADRRQREDLEGIAAAEGDEQHNVENESADAESDEAHRRRRREEGEDRDGDAQRARAVREEIHRQGPVA